MNFLKVKICCVQSLDEAKLAIKYGASAIGLVSEMPSGPGVISEKLILKIASQIPSNIKTFLLTSKLATEDIILQLKKCKTNTVQLVDSVELKVYNKLRKEIPEISIVQVIHIAGKESINNARKVEKYVDAILLDSGNQNKKIKELGGTGRTHNWEISRQIVDQLKIPVYLAGGLNAENIKEAVQFVHPYGVDLCSGVRTNNKLDEDKLKRFFDTLKSLN
ncbi:MAG: phosphoribosylanthranilate isomerase [Ignavibacteria bacterium]|nr:phosphoribosylanthranilate isomerase [Ignavibacteria bacterium]